MNRTAPQRTLSWLRRGLFLLLVSLSLVGTAARLQAQTDTGMTYFRQVTKEAGLWVPRHGDEKVTGQTWGDYDQDGWLDLYVTDDGHMNVLYHNEGDGTFTISPLSPQVALADAVSGGANFVDYDNDGWPDLYVVNWGANALLRNEQGRRFVDVTAAAGVGDTANGKTASWGDYNQDGWLDLYVANWSCSPNCGRPTEGDKDRLYRNNGDGTFTDVTRALGGKTRGAGFVASFVDYDNDGDPDIYLVNDEFVNPIGNVLWRNDGPGCGEWCFTIVSEEAGADTRVMGMGLATGDYDADGDLDFYFSNAGPMTLLQNQGDGTFQNVAASAGVELPAIGWGAVFFDYDNDGWQDLYLALMMAESGGPGLNPLFHNNGDGTFANVTAHSGAADPGATIGVAYADYDQDGWVDLVVGNLDSGYQLYRNESYRHAPNRWLTLKLIGGGPVNRDAVGARVTLIDSHGRSQIQELINGASLGAGNAPELYFGLGKADVLDVVIRWPDGSVQRLGALDSNQRYQAHYDGSVETLTVNQTTPIPLTLSQSIAAMVGIVGLFVAGYLVYVARRA